MPLPLKNQGEKENKIRKAITLLGFLIVKKFCFKWTAPKLKRGKMSDLALVSVCVCVSQMTAVC